MSGVPQPVLHTLSPCFTPQTRVSHPKPALHTLSPCFTPLVCTAPTLHRAKEGSICLTELQYFSFSVMTQLEEILNGQSYFTDQGRFFTSKNPEQARNFGVFFRTGPHFKSFTPEQDPILTICPNFLSKKYAYLLAKDTECVPITKLSVNCVATSLCCLWGLLFFVA